MRACVCLCKTICEKIDDCPHLCLWPQVHKAEAAGESGRQDSREKVRLRSLVVSHFRPLSASAQTVPRLPLLLSLPVLCLSSTFPLVWSLL